MTQPNFETQEVAARKRLAEFERLNGRFPEHYTWIELNNEVRTLERINATVAAKDARIAELETERRELIEELCGSEVPKWQLDAPSFRYVEVQVDKKAWLRWRAEWEAK